MALGRPHCAQAAKKVMKAPEVQVKVKDEAKKKKPQHVAVYLFFDAQNSMVIPNAESQVLTGLRFLHMFS